MRYSAGVGGGAAFASTRPERRFGSSSKTFQAKGVSVEAILAARLIGCRIQIVGISPQRQAPDHDRERSRRGTTAPVKHPYCRGNRETDPGRWWSGRYIWVICQGHISMKGQRNREDANEDDCPPTEVSPRRMAISSKRVPRGGRVDGKIEQEGALAHRISRIRGPDWQLNIERYISAKGRHGLKEWLRGDGNTLSPSTQSDLQSLKVLLLFVLAVAISSSVRFGVDGLSNVVENSRRAARYLISSPNYGFLRSLTRETGPQSVESIRIIIKYK
ncbi:hypothetical protein B0H13DRAFT_1885699 [Mycena leptocephala]|nr:hypothetical protein B0H13DRAFT_1885699 [Mycena leptocephala]